MAGPRADSQSDEYVAQTIRIRAKGLAGKLRATRSDREDFEQRMTLKYLRVKHRFDPGRARLSTFLNRVLTNEEFNIMDEWFAQKRAKERRALRWDEQLDFDDPTTIGDIYSNEDYFTETGQGTRPESETRDLRTSVHWVLKQLPPDLQRIGNALMTMSKADAARHLGIPRTTLYDKIGRIEDAFRKAGMAPIRPGGKLEET